MSGILELNNITVRFKGVTAVDNVSLSLEKGRIYGLIGTNGAGKSTLINVISGNMNPDEGSILFNGTHTETLDTDKVARLGLARTFQNLRVFGTQTVLDNVVTACQHSRKYTIPEMLIFAPRYRREEKEFRDKAFEYMKVMKIEQYADSRADSLPYGLQRRLEIARCLALEPSLLLLDEPAAGMNPQESMQLVDDILMVHDHDPEMTIVIIEHDMKVIMALSEYIYVMAQGKLIAQGSPEEITSSKEVMEAYLGGGHHA